MSSKKRKTIIYGIARYSDGTYKTSRNFVNPEAFSRWANEQFRKDNEVVIWEYHDHKEVRTWSA